MTAIISVKNLSKSFKVGGNLVTVLKNVSLKVEENDFMIIFGPSGCGKSTLLHAILGLEEPSGGSVEILGVNIYPNSEDARGDFRKKNIGMVYQQSNWIKSLNVLENVAFPLFLAGETKENSLGKASASLKNLKMDTWAYYNPSELSSGQQQRVSLARAIVTNPQIVIADEPTGNLDFDSGQELMQLLTSLNSDLKKTIIMVTHDLDYLKFSKTAVKMFDGQIVGQYKDGNRTKIIEEVKDKKK
jgi:ABC-type lipoprotein export system ATPase subunit